MLPWIIVMVPQNFHIQFSNSVAKLEQYRFSLQMPFCSLDEEASSTLTVKRIFGNDALRCIASDSVKQKKTRVSASGLELTPRRRPQTTFV